MTITFGFIERNARRGGIVTNNGFDLHFELTALTGSEKQIAWAEKIRETKLRDLISRKLQRHPVVQKQYFSVADHDQAVAQINETLVKIDALVSKADAASLWIDLRDSSPERILDRLRAEHAQP